MIAAGELPALERGEKAERDVARRPLVERDHAVIALQVGTIQPVNTAIRTRDEAISTHCDVNDDLAGHDEELSPLKELPK